MVNDGTLDTDGNGQYFTVHNVHTVHSDQHEHERGERCEWPNTSSLLRFGRGLLGALCPSLQNTQAKPRRRLT